MGAKGKGHFQRTMMHRDLALAMPTKKNTAKTKTYKKQKHTQTKKKQTTNGDLKEFS